MGRAFRFAAIGCGCLSMLLVGSFALLIGAEMAGVGLSRYAATPTAGSAAKVVPTTPAQPQVTFTPFAVVAPTPVPKTGQGVVLTTPGGLKLVVTANAVLDPSPSENQFNKPQGRWVVVDWTIRNDGQADQQVSASWLKIMTQSGYVVGSGNHAGHREPGFESGVLGPGQLRRGFLAYDTPPDQRVKSVFFQSPGNRQFVIAELAQ